MIIESLASRTEQKPKSKCKSTWYVIASVVDKSQYSVIHLLNKHTGHAYHVPGNLLDA